MRITTYRTELDEDKKNVLVKEKSMNYNEYKSLSSPAAVSDMFKACFRMDKLAEEHLYMISMNGKNKPLGIFEISHGTCNCSISNPREIFIRLLLSGASSFVLAHNHPCGDTTPSKDDLETTKRILECSKLIGINLLDHIIIGDNYYSFLESGFMKN